MNTKQQSKLKMYLTVRIMLLSNPAITANLPNFPEFMAALDAAILQIQTHSEHHQQHGKGNNDNKKYLREQLTNQLLDAAGKLHAFAKYIHDTVLLSQSKLSRTELNAVSSLDFVVIARNLYNLIETHLGSVAPYNLNSISQSQLRQTIDAYNEVIPQFRQTQLQGKEDSLLEKQGFYHADVAIDNIDALMEIVRFSEPVFYANYKNARKIIDQGVGSLQVQGTVTEAATGKPIHGATFTFRLSGKPEVVLEKETAEKGGFNIKSLAEGIYEITVTKVGFQTKTLNVVVDWNELCVLEVALERV
jgi:hypothetical protein